MHCKDVITICVAPKNQNVGFLIILANILYILRYALKKKYGIIWEFFPIWGGGVFPIPKLL